MSRRQNRLEVKVDSSQEECLSVFGSDPHVYQTTVKSIQTDEAGRLQAVVTVDLEPVYDSQRRLTMKELSGTEKILPCQLLVVPPAFWAPAAMWLTLSDWTQTPAATSPPPAMPPTWLRYTPAATAVPASPWWSRP